MPDDPSSKTSAALSAEHRRLVDLVIGRAEQACRYALKFQQFDSGDAAYRDGWTTGAEVCEGAIRAHVERHIAEDIEKDKADGNL